MLYGMIAGLLVICASIIGSALGLLFQKISHKANDTILGFAAGIMLAAGFLGLLPTAFDGNWSQKIVATIGVLVGALFISSMDRFVPHIHMSHGEMQESETKSTLPKTFLIVLAIAIHNIPEGLATGIVFGEGITDNAKLVAISMMLQKIPEGLIVAIPLIQSGMSKAKAFLISIAVALMMLPGVILGVALGSLPRSLSAFFYAVTFGAIVYVISDEVIPESHEHGFQRSATFALIIGILSVVLLQG